MITHDFLREKLSNSLHATHVESVVEGSGCDSGAKVQLTVVSELFGDKSLLQRHRLVNEVFAEELRNNQIHAICIKAYTPAQYDAKK